VKRSSVFDGRSSGPAPKRRQWAAALAVSFAAHLLVLAGLLAEIDRPPPPPVQPPVTVTLERPIRVPKPPEPKPAEKPVPPKQAPVKVAPSPPPPPAPAPRPVQAPQPIAPLAPPAAQPGFGRAPATAPPAIVAGTPPAADAGANANCIAKYMEKMGQKERAACENRIFSVMDKYDGKVPPPPPGSTIDPEKMAAYDAAMAKKHYKNRPITPQGNGAQTGQSCKQANNGLGCMQDMLVPLGDKSF
jgi:hypothetical protein